MTEERGRVPSARRQLAARHSRYDDPAAALRSRSDRPAVELSLLAADGYVLAMSEDTGSTSFGEKFAQAIERDPLKAGEVRHAGRA